MVSKKHYNYGLIISVSVIVLIVVGDLIWLKVFRPAAKVSLSSDDQSLYSPVPYSNDRYNSLKSGQAFLNVTVAAADTVCTNLRVYSTEDTASRNSISAAPYGRSPVDGAIYKTVVSTEKTNSVEVRQADADSNITGETCLRAIVFSGETDQIEVNAATTAASLLITEDITSRDKLSALTSSAAFETFKTWLLSQLKTTPLSQLIYTSDLYDQAKLVNPAVVNPYTR